jgi:hypothetical protein
VTTSAGRLRPAVTESEAVTAAVSTQSTKSQPAARTVPTLSSSTVATVHSGLIAPEWVTGGTAGPRPIAVGCAQPRSDSAVSAAAPASPATAHPTPGRSSGTLAAATRPAIPVAPKATASAGLDGPGQRCSSAVGGRGP